MQDAVGNFVGKPFEQEVYNKTDKRAFEELVKHFKVLKLKQNPNKTGIDVLVYLNEEDRDLDRNLICVIELDVRLADNVNWVKGKYEHPVVKIFYRKRKHIKAKVEPYHVTFNSDYTDCILIPYSEIITKGVYSESMLQNEDWVAKVPITSRVKFGFENLESSILRYAFKCANSSHNINYGIEGMVDNTDDNINLLNESKQIAFDKVSQQLRVLKLGVNADTVCYMSEEERKSGVNPICTLDLNTKLLDWVKDEYPSKTIKIPVDKRSLIYKKEVPFFMAFNSDYSDCMLIPYSLVIQSDIIQEKHNKKLVWLYEVPKSLVKFGFENLEIEILRYVLQFANSVHNATYKTEGENI